MLPVTCFLARKSRCVRLSDPGQSQEACGVEGCGLDGPDLLLQTSQEHGQRLKRRDAGLCDYFRGAWFWISAQNDPELIALSLSLPRPSPGGLSGPLKTLTSRVCEGGEGICYFCPQDKTSTLFNGRIMEQKGNSE